MNTPTRRRFSKVGHKFASFEILNTKIISSYLHVHVQGTNSQNPHNDYCQNFIDTGQYPANYIRDVAMDRRFAEYPKLNELIEKKNTIARESHCPLGY